MAIQSVNNNSQQNNLYAMSVGTIAGTAGAFAGYNMAPRAAKNMDEFLNLSADTFSRALGNMQKKNPEMYMQNYPLISAKLALEAPDARLERIFETDKISVSKLTEEIKKEEKSAKQTLDSISKFIKDISKKKGKSISLEEYFEQIKTRKIMSEEAVLAMAEDMKSTIGEEGFKQKITVDEEFIKFYREHYKYVEKYAKEDIEFFKKLLKLKKGDYVYKSDAVESVKKQIKPELDKYIAEIKKAIPFDSIKKYIPRVDQAKWTLIAGSAAALLSAGVVKLFGNNNKN